ncbi:conjugal transfer protein [Carnobacterium divergens]|uniref:TcpE family conjugal transfer membrane protein n=1 Tax=Carnobacterium TaxID=2747 RepID=UPI00054D6B9D|nr:MULTISPECIES: TcpE family conjugal transfer membrane protein [Carnobacterium]TFI72253.1 conjugal transfer protein [Carnobacterium divergens]TFJ40454.1 conjugal transfer protein [Carnobacterium divergens]TFJ49074.1 conjugal transfer protein [Carnobacterium divergens]TFJ54338.1 conjugal transfer protein [Carnobacterium divergens]TFJ59864.1 conjugal transfer protein [Carnobacterium divergens]
MNIKVFTKVWNVEKLVYRINDINLPFVVSTSQIKYFITSFMFFLIFGKLPIISLVSNSVFNKIGLSVLIALGLSKLKFDGKSPISFLKSVITYFNRGRLTTKGKKVKVQKYTFNKTITVVRRLDHVSD